VNNRAGRIKLTLTRNLDYQGQGTEIIFNYYNFVNVNPSTGAAVSTDTGTIALAGNNSVMSKGKAQSSTSFNAAAFLNRTINYNLDELKVLFLDQFNKSILPYGDHLIIRRANSSDNFGLWETVDNINIAKQDLVQLYWYDYTAEPGYWYRYQVLRYNSRNEKTA